MSAQMSEEIVETATEVIYRAQRDHGYWSQKATCFCGHPINGSSVELQKHLAQIGADAVLAAVAPALTAEKDAEIARVQAVGMDILMELARERGRVMKAEHERDAARAEGAAEVSAAVEALCSEYETKRSGIGPWVDEVRQAMAAHVRAAATPDGVAAHNAKIAAGALESATKAIAKKIRPVQSHPKEKSHD